MMMINPLREYPDGSDILFSLLKKFSVLKEEQILIFFTQFDKSFNKKRSQDLIDKLVSMGDILREKIEDCSYIKKDDSADPDEYLIDAFWVFLHYADQNIRYDPGDYPAEIVFMKNKTVHEIIVMDDESEEKIDYLSKRKPRNSNCHYDFLFTSGTIDCFDDELLPADEVTLITADNLDAKTPKLLYHEIESL